MSQFNTKYILPGDSKDVLLSKLNQNFNQVYFNGVGEMGPDGAIGATGIIGQAGEDGSQGSTGDRAANWYFSPDQPSAVISQAGDIWINLGVTGGQKVYQYTTDWVYTGETIQTTGIFGTLTEISGPAGSVEDNAIVINSSPGDKYMVISDSEGTTGDINPNFAKLLISTANSSSPIFGMDKPFADRSNIAGFYWGSSSSSDYSLVWKNPNLSRYAGSSVSIGSTGSNVTAQSSNLLNVKSSGSIELGATGTNLQLYAFSGNVNIESSNLRTNSAEFSLSFSGTSGLTPDIAFSNRDLNYFGSFYQSFRGYNTNHNKGISVNLSGSPYDGAGGLAQAYLAGTSGGRGIAVGGDGTIPQVGHSREQSFMVRSRGDAFQIGSRTGASGITGGTLTRYTQLVTSPFTQTFTLSGQSYHYVSVAANEDVVVIEPAAIATSPSGISADGRIGRFYLSIGSSYTWTNYAAGKYRTIEYLVNDANRSFGGIRAISAGTLNKDYISIPDNYADGTNPGKYGCKRLRLTFIPGNNYCFYEAWADSENVAAGWLQISGAEIFVPGGGGGVAI